VGPLYARMLAAHGETGLWPLLLTERGAPVCCILPHRPTGSANRSGASSPLPANGRPWHPGDIFPVPAASIDGLDPGDLLAKYWTPEARTYPDNFHFGWDAFPGVRHPSWPGLAEPATPGPDPDEVLTRMIAASSGVRRLTDNDQVYLGLVPAADSAAALTTAGWIPDDASAPGIAEIAAVIRSWQERFGVRLCAVGFDTLRLSVAWPPATLEHARLVAAEHVALCPEITFCPQLTYHDHLAEYARRVQGARVWELYWNWRPDGPECLAH
jgi:hypothetical protein